MPETPSSSLGATPIDRGAPRTCFRRGVGEGGRVGQRCWGLRWPGCRSARIGAPSYSSSSSTLWEASIHCAEDAPLHRSAIASSSSGTSTSFSTSTSTRALNGGRCGQPRPSSSRGSREPRNFAAGGTLPRGYRHGHDVGVIVLFRGRRAWHRRRHPPTRIGTSSSPLGEASIDCAEDAPLDRSSTASPVTITVTGTGSD